MEEPENHPELRYAAKGSPGGRNVPDNVLIFAMAFNCTYGVNSNVLGDVRPTAGQTLLRAENTACYNDHEQKTARDVSFISCTAIRREEKL